MSLLARLIKEGREEGLPKEEIIRNVTYAIIDKFSLNECRWKGYEDKKKVKILPFYPIKIE